MEATPKISAAEWEIANIVWDHHPISAPDVLKRLPETSWKQKTVNTFLTRLVEKGVLEAKRNGKANLYWPKLKREECVQEESHAFLNRVFKGTMASMVLHFVENEILSPDQIKELQQILKKRSKS
jgi:BlaI family transcriptional regulator, penicillinase repressor